MTFTNLDPQKFAEQSRKTNHPSCEAPLMKCVTSWTLEGGGVWRAHNKLTHRFSERGRKQILFCQAKYTQTPYQFMAVMDPAGRRSPLASGGPFGCATAHKKLLACQRVHARRVRLSERAEA